MSIYEDNGFKNRQDYIDSLAEEYGQRVYIMADILGPTEDFDGLVTSLEDSEDFE